MAPYFLFSIRAKTYLCLSLQTVTKSNKKGEIYIITVDMLDAIKVQFLKPLFEDDFIDRRIKFKNNKNR